MKDPFLNAAGIGAVDVESRLRDVADFDPKQLRAALKVSGLQKTVKTAIERRLKKLAEEKNA